MLGVAMGLMVFLGVVLLVFALVLAAAALRTLYEVGKIIKKQAGF